jgi:hypothetical protein
MAGSLLLGFRQGGYFLFGNDVFALVIENWREPIPLNEAANSEGVEAKAHRRHFDR